MNEHLDKLGELVMKDLRGQAFDPAVRAGVGAAIVLWLSTLALQAQEQVAPTGRNLLTNGSFERGLSGWSTHPAASVDTQSCHEGKACLKISAHKRRVFIRCDSILPSERGARALTCTYWGKAERARRYTGVELAVKLASGKIAWFIPTYFRLDRYDVEWTQRKAVYVAPEDDAIVNCDVLAINDSQGDVWIDDIQVEARAAIRVQETTAPVALLKTEQHPHGVKALTTCLRAAGIEFDTVDEDQAYYGLDVEPYELLVIPYLSRGIAHFGLTNYHYLGGRLLVLDAPRGRHVTRLFAYLWGRRPDDDSRQQRLVSEDRRAVYAGDWSRLPVADRQGILESLSQQQAVYPDIQPVHPPDPNSMALRNDVLYIDGEPILFRALWGFSLRTARPGARSQRPSFNLAGLQQAQALGLNGVQSHVSWDVGEEDYLAFLEACQAHNLKAIMWIHGPKDAPLVPIKDEWLHTFFKYQNHPAFLGYFLRTDARQRDYPWISRATDMIRRYDKHRLILFDLLSYRHVDATPDSRWEMWRKLDSPPFSYVYTLQYDGKWLGKGYLEGENRMLDIVRLSDNIRRVWGRDVYHWQAPQAHTQSLGEGMLGFSSREMFFATAEQERLITYTTVSAGVKGLCYFAYPYIQDARMGTGRRNELGICWHELGLVDGLLAAGRRGRKAVSLSREDVDATAFVRGGETLLLLVKHDPFYNRCVHDGEVSGLRVSLSVPDSRGLSVYHLAYPEIKQIACEEPSAAAVGFVVPAFDLTSVVLISRDPRRAAGIRRRMQRDFPEVARMSLAVLEDKQYKNGLIMGRIREVAPRSAIPPDVREALQTGDDDLRLATQLFEAGNCVGAYAASRRGLLAHRAARMRTIQQADRYAQQNGLANNKAVMIYLNNFFSLPAFYRECREAGKGHVRD